MAKNCPSAAGPHRLPAPHDRVEFKIYAYIRGYGPDPTSLDCTVQYSGSAEDLIAAGVVTREMITDKTGRIFARGDRTRRDSAGGKIRVRFLKYEIVVDYHDAFDLELTLPGVTDELLVRAAAEAKAKADAEWKDYEARRAPAVEEEDHPDSHSIQLLARKAKRGAERKRPAILRLVVDNTQAARP
jgi:hypothetical protein